MKGIMNTIIIFLKDDVVSIQIDGESASYPNDGSIQAFAGIDKNKLPQSIIVNDYRSKKCTVSNLDEEY